MWVWMGVGVMTHKTVMLPSLDEASDVVGRHTYQKNLSPLFLINFFKISVLYGINDHIYQVIMRLVYCKSEHEQKSTVCLQHSVLFFKSRRYILSLYSCNA